MTQVVKEANEEVRCLVRRSDGRATWVEEGRSTYLTLPQRVRSKAI